MHTKFKREKIMRAYKKLTIITSQWVDSLGIGNKKIP
jgi:hypothetical protein